MASITIVTGHWAVIPHQYQLLGQVDFRSALGSVCDPLVRTLRDDRRVCDEVYAPRASGYNRFFVLYAIFVLGMVITSLAGTIETLFAGWELVGLSSALLVAFFQERSAPSRNGLWVWVVYRVSDAALLLAAVVMHHLRGEGDFDSLLGAGPWPDGISLVAPDQALVVGMLLVVAAAGKSALIPFSGWLPRAMEGPTPSSAVFYGALSVHLGAFMLLRVSPLLVRSPLLCAIIVVLGLTTAIFAYLTASVQTDIKSALSFASLSQVGLIVAEIGLGFRYVAAGSSSGPRLPANAPVRACANALARLPGARKRDRRPVASNGHSAGTDEPEPAPGSALPPGTGARASRFAPGGVCGPSVRPDVPMVRCHGAALDRFPFRPGVAGIRPG